MSGICGLIETLISLHNLITFNVLMIIDICYEVFTKQISENETRALYIDKSYTLSTGKALNSIYMLLRPTHM